MLIFVAVIGGIFAFDVASDRTPVLGLDLRGGLSVIYATTEPADEEDLTAIRDLMRDQLESFGIAEPDVRVEGENIIVDLPGVADQTEAFEALQVSGIVELRPVLQCQATLPTPSTVPGSTDPAGSAPPTTEPGASVGTSVPATSAPDQPADDDESGAGPADQPTTARRLGFASTATPGDTAPSTAPAATTAPADTAPEPTPTESVPTATTPPTEPPVLGPPAPTTTLAPDTTGQITASNADGTEVCVLGPQAGTGEVFERKSATVNIDPQTAGWVVNSDLRGDGEAAWNAIAAQCFSGSPTCPAAAGGRGRLAIVLDGVIQSAPTVNAPSFDGTVSISGAFTEQEARDLAQTINRGAFPVQVEQQRVETVSPTAGDSAFDAAMIAGLIGVGLTLLYMVAYYRRLSVVIIAGLAVWGLLVYVIATYISRETNYAFTLAGATGIIVSIGVTVDTYIVFFERLKDEVRAGRQARNAALRAFSATWRTIVAANLVALLSATVLFFLSVGSVRGFALYLAVTTICDVAVLWFFVRPFLFLLADTKWLDSADPKSIGIGTAIGGAS
jgi:preprotein translocase subunit SecD